MAKQTRRRIGSAVFFFSILALTLWYVFRGENLSQVADCLSDANLGYVALAVAAVIAFILGESVVIFYLLRRLGAKPKFSHCSLFSFVGFFYSAITPSASGGQPMQVLYMRRDGISEEYARLRISAQQPGEYFSSRCDYTLVNDAGSPEEFALQCGQLLNKIL